MNDHSYTAGPEHFDPAADVDETVFPDPDVPGHNAGMEEEWFGGGGWSVPAAPGASWSDQEPNFTPADGDGSGTYADPPQDTGYSDDSGADGAPDPTAEGAGSW